MSIKTWRAEFYPKRAKQVAKRDAVSHSLHKWRGLTKSNLRKHGLVNSEWGDLTDCDGGTFVIDETTCALCAHYMSGQCRSCPLWQSLGGRRCAGSHVDEFSQWILRGNPKPMIQALEKTKRIQDKQIKAKS